MLRVLQVRWLSAAGKKTLDGRRPGRGIYPIAVDEAVVGAATARWRMGWRKEEAGRSGELVVAPIVYEWGNGGGDLKLWDVLL